MNRDELYWNSPAVVEVEYHNGRRADLAFDTRLEAEAYVGQIPWLQAAGDDTAESIFAAVIRQAAVGLN
jgi:hypothetical protein